MTQRLVIAGDRFEDADGPIDQELDTQNLFAIGGLVDAHAHLAGGNIAEMQGAADEEQLILARTNAAAQLDGGVFLVLDKGSKTDITLRILEEPLSARPDLQMAGSIIRSPDGYYPDFGVETDEAGLADAVRSAAQGPATWVKVIGDWPRKGVGPVPNFSEGGLRSAVAVAHKAGCRVAIHTAAPDTASMAVQAGVDSIEHGLFLTDEDLKALGARGGAWVPTIFAMEELRDMLGAERSGGKLLTRGLGNVADLLPRAERYGVTVLAGSDIAMPHGAVALEASKLVEYGLSSAAAIAALTNAAYDYAGVERGFAPGMPADAVLFDVDPLEDVTVLERPVMVIRRGVVRYTALR